MHKQPVTFSLSTWVFIVATTLVIATVIFFIQQYFEKKKWKKIEKLKQCGAIPFLADALQIRRTLDAINAEPENSFFNTKKTLAAWKEQGKIQNESRRAIKGTVCGEEIQGWVKAGEITLAVENTETKKALEEALTFMTDRGHLLYLGLRLKMTFM